MRLLGDLIDVVGEPQGDDVGLQAVDHGTRLLARAAVRLLDGHLLAGLRQPALGEGFVDRLVQLAGRVVRDVEQRDLDPRLRSGRVGPQAGGAGEQDGGDPDRQD